MPKHLNGHVIIIIAFLISSGVIATNQDPAKEEEKVIISTENAPKAIGPYSQAVKFGSMLFISGQIGVDPSTGNLSTSAEAQTKQAMENLRAILRQANMSFEDVVQARIYLADIGDFQKVNEVYASYFKGDYPARSTLQAAALPKGAKVEIEMMAIRAQES